MLYQLSYTRMPLAEPPISPRRGGGRIRTYVGRNPADLQSAAISHSATPPDCLTSHPKRNPAPTNSGVPGGSTVLLTIPQADEGTRTLNLLITNQLLYQLSYISRTA